VRLTDLEAITFDCWGTLIYDVPGTDGRSSYDLRVDALARLGELDRARADELLREAWAFHHDEWHAERSYGSPGMAEFCLTKLSLPDPALQRELTDAFEEASVDCGVAMVDDVDEVLEEIRRRGLRTALVCDTGFTPGRVVRRLLAEHGLDRMLDVLAFSDEVGVPKPNARMFGHALDGIRVSAAAGAHVGDLRRTDVAGARAAGMRTVRFAGVYDDGSELPDADLVINAMPELLGVLDDGRAEGPQA